MTQGRTRNEQLAALIDEARWSHAQVAAALVRVASENGADELAGVGRSHASHWVRGTRPSGRASILLCEALSRRLGRIVSVDDAGLGSGQQKSEAAADWHTDTLTALAALGSVDLDMDRRRALGALTYGVTVAALPSDGWWNMMSDRGRRRNVADGKVGRGDVETVQDMVTMFSRMDQRRGGGHARAAVVQYLSSDVAKHLTGTFQGDQVRRDMFSAASELAYLSGWMAFDNNEHATAQQYFSVATKLAAEADDAPMAGHILRAMAHQAVDLEHPTRALQIANASVEGARYSEAVPRERALLGVVHARAFAANGDKHQAAAALTRAESDLASAQPGDNEPGRVFFFQEASLAHETACTLRDIGDLDGAAREFRRSVLTRQASTFTRTHAVTLGYLGSIQVEQGNVEDGCATWSQALDMMDGIQSGRTRQTARDMRSALSPFRRRQVRAAEELDSRAAAYLEATA